MFRSDDCFYYCLGKENTFCTYEGYSMGTCFDEKETLDREVFCSNDWNTETTEAPLSLRSLTCPNEDFCYEGYGVNDKNVYLNKTGEPYYLEANKAKEQLGDFKAGEVCGYIIHPPSDIEVTTEMKFRYEV
jgi:hypothetical protein